MGKIHRKQRTPEEKMDILKRHLIGNENVSDICDEIGIHPNQFYKWQADLFSSASEVFGRKNSPKRQNSQFKRLEDEKSRLSKLLEKKDTVIAEITEDYVRLKKKNTDPFEING